MNTSVMLSEIELRWQRKHGLTEQLIATSAHASTQDHGVPEQCAPDCGPCAKIFS